MDPVAAHIRKNYAYSPETGILRGLKANKAITATDRDGYINVAPCIAGRSHYRAVHRCAFLFMLGRWPEGVVDHINGHRGDNRWANLREVSLAENQAATAHRIGRSVVRVNGRFAPIWSTFSTYEEAAAAAALLDDPCAVLTGG